MLAIQNLLSGMSRGDRPATVLPWNGFVMKVRTDIPFAIVSQSVWTRCRMDCNIVASERNVLNFVKDRVCI